MLKKVSFILLISALLAAVSSCREGYTVPFYVGCPSDAEPFSYYDEKGNLTGIEIDLMNAIAEKEGLWFKFISTSQEDVLNELRKKRHKMDCGLGMIEWTIQREDDYSFVNPAYYTSSIALAALKSSDDIKSYQDMNGKVMAVKSRTLIYEYAASIAEEYGFTIKTFEKYSEVINAVETGQADALMEHYPMVKYRIDKNTANLKIVENGPKNLAFAIITQKGEDKTLRSFIFSAFVKMLDDDTVEKIIKKYLPE